MHPEFFFGTRRDPAKLMDRPQEGPPTIAIPARVSACALCAKAGKLGARLRCGRWPASSNMADADQNQALWTEIASLLREDEQERLDELRRLADRVSDRIIASDDPPFEIAREIEKVREKCRELFPDKDDLFDLIYVNRFRRLWEQFRGGEPPF